MIHPDTEVRVVSPEIGLGVYATKFIPKGTILYVIDDLELIFPEGNHKLTDEHYRKYIEKFSYTDQEGNRIVSWDHAKYINHYCDRNSISTGYSFEIALRDILPGEQITDDYGALNIEEPMKCYCGKSQCRGTIQPNDLLTYANKWDDEIRSSIELVEKVDQPLMYYIDGETRSKLDDFLKTGKDFASVRNLYYEKVKVTR